MRKLSLLIIALAMLPFIAIAQTSDDEDYWPVIGQDYAGDQTTATDSKQFRELFQCDFFLDGLAYTILSQEDRTVEVTNLHWEEITGERWIYVADTIRIPETVSFENETYTVTAIGRGAFSGSYVHYVEIPSTVTEIGAKAFSYVTGMKELLIPNSVKIIGDYAFAGEAGTGKFCPGKIIFAEGLKIESLGVYVFAHRRGKDIPQFPDYLTIVPEGTYCDNGMTRWTTLSDNVEVIASEAFAENDFVSVPLPGHLKELGDMAFYNCKNLKSATIPASVTAFGDKVFGSSSTQCFLETLELLPVTPPESHAVWEDGAIKYSETTLIVPKGASDLYRQAWGLSLTQILEAEATVPGSNNGYCQDDATDVINGFDVCEWFNCDIFADRIAFNILSEQDHTLEVTNLRLAEMSSDLWIYRADTLKIPEKVVWNDVAYTVKSIGPWAFSRSEVGCLVIPPSVSAIKEHAFSFVGEGMKKITIPSTVTKIEDYAFGYNEGKFPQYEYSKGVSETHVDTLQFLSDTPNINQTIPVKTVLIVPDGTRDRYREALSPNGDSYTIYEADEVTGIFSPKTSISDESYYSLDGRRLNSPVKGINIIRMKDGTTKKVLVN